MRVTLSDSAVFAVNEQFAALVSGDFACGVDRLLLRAVHRAGSLTPCATDCPTSVMRNDVLISASHVYLLVGVILTDEISLSSLG